MATEITARAKQSASAAPGDSDYQAFCAALSASARGRAFLTEYTRRNRNADTEQLLAAIAQLQQAVSANSVPKITVTIKAELRALLDEIATAQNQLEANIVATRATKLAELIALVARRITAMMDMTQAETAPPVSVSQAGSPHEAKQESKPESTLDLNIASKDAIERTRFAVVPTPDQPELPIPSPLVTPLPAITLVRSEAIMVEVPFGPPAPDAKPASGKIDEPNAEAPGPAVAVAKTLKPADPLASIKALSEEERLALFT